MADAEVSLGLSAQELYQELQNVQSHFAQFASKTTEQGEQASQGFVSRFKAGLGSLGTNIVQGLAALGLGSKIKEVVEYGTEIENLSRRYGVPTEALQKFGNASERQFGVSKESLAKFFGFLEINQAKALGGNEAAIKSFEGLGITLKDLQSQSVVSEEFLTKLGQGNLNPADLKKVGGKGALDDRPFLAALGDKTVEFGEVIPDREIKKLKELDDIFVSLAQNIRILGADLIGGFVRNFQASIAELTTRAYAAVVEIKGLGEAIAGSAKSRTSAAGEEIKGLGSALGKVVQGDFKGAGDEINAARDRADGKVGESSFLKTIDESRQRANDIIEEGKKLADEYRSGKTDDKKYRDLSKPLASESAEFDELGQPITKSQQRAEEKAEREEERAENAKERARVKSEQDEFRRKEKGEVEAEGDRRDEVNPEHLTLHDYASAKNSIGNRTAALAKEGEREEKAARDSAISGDKEGSERHRARADEIKHALGIETSKDKIEQHRKALDSSEVLRKIRDNTEDLGANK